MFRQGPDHISAALQRSALRAVGEYQAQHSTGGLSEGGGEGVLATEPLYGRGGRDILPELSHSASDGSTVFTMTDG